MEGPVIYPQCKHPYCVKCFQKCIRIATRDESAFPPKCCGTNGYFAFARYRMFLKPKVAKQFALKLREYMTTDRVYCHDRVCSAFLGPALVRIAAYECAECEQFTCGHCRGPGHSAFERCSADTMDQDVLELAKQEGWQQCLSCSNVIQLSFGCNHMTCRCGFEFCYVCAKEWKNCDCPTWNEQELRAAQLRDPEEWLAWEEQEYENAPNPLDPGDPLGQNRFLQQPLHPPLFAPQPPQFVNAQMPFAVVPGGHAGFARWDAPLARTWDAAPAAPVIPGHFRTRPRTPEAATHLGGAESSTSSQIACTHGPWTRVPDVALHTSADSVCKECGLRGANRMYVSRLLDPDSRKILTFYHHCRPA